MKKTKLITLILALSVTASAFIGCSKSETGDAGKASSDKAVEITWWNYPNYAPIDNTPGKYEQKIIENFNKKYPNIKVNVEMMDFASGPQKLNTAIASNSAPDLVYDYPGRIIDYARNGVMAELDSMFTDSFKSDVPEKILDACKFDGKYYMYPINTTPNMMAFNKTMLEKAGLLDMLPLDKEDRTWTNDEYIALLKAIKEKVPGVVPSAMYAKSSAGDQGTRPYIANMGGGQIISPDLKEYVMNDPNEAKALKWIVDSTKEGLTLKGGEALTSNDMIDMFLQQKIAVSILYSPVLKKTSEAKKTEPFEEVFVPYPTPSIEQKPFLEAFVGGIGIFDNKDPDKIEAAKKLVDFIANDEATFKENLVSTGGFSVKSSVTGLYKDPESVYCEGMIKYLGTYYNAVPGFSEMRTFWFPTLQEVLIEKSEPQEALDQFVKDSNATLTKK
ncbi:ABC transporter substrate-binding protein [Clostridium algidicarnis]|uniref:ABC transporter substrate-binding protein n=1 Tax=Clostridium algidicarnis TaxID=37659 RepID=UPI001C0AE847|nr:ABC transporter substrate-binding protein [Clostridium algidicarnis]MBU3197561.1 ABC transporter substrate-binding protein [Clostridium algidicarnis]MBU3210677.1 ABC transporter substrate-binding protein [Clostridium algidicarnis]MBU3229128.1 ABC transporter substrate-binding protein [Clostridium algidicarnis]MBU3252639.1 ABC transporter substrate-binding protein [Clostridium algidicarnis]